MKRKGGDRRRFTSISRQWNVFEAERKKNRIKEPLSRLLSCIKRSCEDGGQKLKGLDIVAFDSTRGQLSSSHCSHDQNYQNSLLKQRVSCHLIGSGKIFLLLAPTSPCVVSPDLQWNDQRVDRYETNRRRSFYMPVVDSLPDRDGTAPVSRGIGCLR